jgi:hypothetical protein
MRGRVGCGTPARPPLSSPLGAELNAWYEYTDSGRGT